MPLQNLYQLLYSTPIDRLQSVEVMYSAPAKYHVNGAVINIVLKTPRPLDGLMGQVNAGYNQTRYATYSGGVNATYAITDWTFDFNWTISRNHSYGRQETFSNHLINGDRIPVDDDMRQISENLSNIIYAAASFKKLKVSYNGQITSGISNRSLSNGTFGTFSNKVNGLAPTAFHNIAMRYAAPFGLTAGADYTNYRENRSQNLFKDNTEHLYSEHLKHIAL